MKKFIFAAIAAAVIGTAAWAVLPATPSYVAYTAAGGTQFTFSFKVLDSAHVKVYDNSVLVVGADYALALNANQDTNPGGTVTFNVAPTAGHTILISRIMPVSQDCSFTPYSAFRAKTLEGCFDALAMRQQQLQGFADLAVGPAGPQGPTGPAGPTGPSGPSGPSGPAGSIANITDTTGCGSAPTANWSVTVDLSQKFLTGDVSAIYQMIPSTGAGAAAFTIPAGCRPDGIGKMYVPCVDVTSGGAVLCSIGGRSTGSPGVVSVESGLVVGHTYQLNAAFRGY